MRRDEAYVLRTLELGESDLIVSLFAREHGKVRGVARSARKSRRRYGGSLEPLTLVRLTWAERTGRELHRLETMDCLHSYASMQGDPAIQAACAVLSELSETLAREGQAEERAFRLLGAVVEALEQGCDPWVAVRYFESWMLRIHGLLPDLVTCGVCSTALPARRPVRVTSRGQVRCNACADRSGERHLALGSREREFLQQAWTRPPNEVSCAPRILGPGTALEGLLRGTLEGFVERRFRAYRHLALASRAPGETHRS